MAAAAYKVAMSVAVDGKIKNIPLTASDVNGEFWLFPDGSSSLPLGQGSAVIREIIYSSAGTDTSSVDVFVNGINTGYRIFNALNLGTTINRQVSNSPIGISPGASVKFKQNT
jgi:hypothetical protein